MAQNTNFMLVLDLLILKISRNQILLVAEIELESVEFGGSGEFSITRSSEFCGFSFVGREFSDSLEIVSFSADSMTLNVLFVEINGK